MGFIGVFSSIRLVLSSRSRAAAADSAAARDDGAPPLATNHTPRFRETEAASASYWLLSGSITVSLGAHLGPRAGHLPRRDAEQEQEQEQPSQVMEGPNNKGYFKVGVDLEQFLFIN